ncbi:DUF4345 domain-containing protein [Ponticaulis koreensis]|uniref:DUF4345 domain-containing protein n=1 Tax=Ponticaulis koreensis TaxID=1123045 RepID=UPI0003B6B07E|nr:DUF4345 domain-containing protein [Ponticaulis koreensis]
MKRPFSRATLGLSALILLVISAMILFAPAQFYASSSIELSAGTNLMSELKAAAGLLFVSALCLIAGAIFLRYTRTALRLNALIFGAYALGRLVSMAIDGIPSDALVHATGIEVVVALTSVALLFAARNQPVLL